MRRLLSVEVRRTAIDARIAMLLQRKLVLMATLLMLAMATLLMRASSCTGAAASGRLLSTTRMMRLQAQLRLKTDTWMTSAAQLLAVQQQLHPHP